MIEFPDWMLWAMSLAALPLGIVVLGGSRRAPALVCVLVLFWMQIVGDLVAAQIANEPMGSNWFGAYQGAAIAFSLCAMLALATGMRLGLGRAQTAQSLHSDQVATGAIDLRRGLVAYAVCLAGMQLADAAVRLAPTLTQAFLALGLIRHVLVYLIAASVFRTGRGYVVLLLVVLFELVTSTVSFFADYKNVIFVILIALVASGRKLDRRQLLVGVGALVVVVWMSLVWSGMKIEYRTTMIRRPAAERSAWLASHYLSNNTDWKRAAIMLAHRIGYTGFYALVIRLEDNNGLPPDMNLYQAAVRHIVTPRLFFPNKPQLNDSLQTTELLKIPIARSTSIGIGYVAQAHVDFGFPGLLAPILAIGAILGFATRYFLTRNAPLIVRSAFATAATFLAFRYETNIDKSLGGFLTGVIVLALIMRLGYPQIGRWLSGAKLEVRHGGNPSTGVRAPPAIVR